MFQLTLGCSNNCTHCINHLLGDVVCLEVEKVVSFIKRQYKSLGINQFVNLDPNISLLTLSVFLDKLITLDIPVSIYLFGGTQPDFLTPKLLEKMHRAKVSGLTVPRELDPTSNQKLNKLYTPKDFYRAIENLSASNLKLEHLHCTLPIGLERDNLQDIMKAIKEIHSIGAIAEIAPISYIPKTVEYDRHVHLLKGKTLEELNWALWPTLDSQHKIELYKEIYNYAHHGQYKNCWPVHH